jgi:4-alpha-glucanotransferase
VIERSAGLLCHITSLPGLGEEAYRFVEFCVSAGQRWWQLLPVAPAGAGGSPYSALSAFAGSEELLTRETLGDNGFRAFRHRNRFWLDDYALFRALRAAHEEASWTSWPRGLRDREPRAMARARDAHAVAIEHFERAQYDFERQWAALKSYANERGVALIGDLPIFVAHDSADVWAHRRIFKLGSNGKPTVVAGVPPDYFSADGQRWGNPHYRWDVLKRRRYDWWIARVRRMFKLFDAVRLDHFLGFLRAWEVPARARSARRGRWAPGPGEALFKAVRRAVGRRLMIAEDLGLLTPRAARLRDRLGLPGMRVLHFSFGGNPDDLPHAFPRDSVVYTGTHDNNTTRGWFKEGGADRERARRYAGCRRDSIHWGLIRVAYASPSNLAVVPVQDLLGLDARARLNTPGTTKGNWRWRLRRGALDRKLARRLHELKEATGR